MAYETQLNIRLDRDQFDRLSQVARVEGKTPTEIAREGIDLVIERYQKDRAWARKQRAWIKDRREKLARELRELE